MPNPTDNAPGSNLQPTGQPLPMQPGEFTPSAPANLVSFLTNKVTPPSPLYLQRDDVIGLQAASSLANETVFVSGRFLAVSDGLIHFFSQAFPITVGTYTLQLFSLALSEGWLLALQVVPTVASQPGQTFTRALIERGSPQISQLQNLVQVLISGYGTRNRPLGWPGGRMDQPGEGRGALSAQTIASPAAGADFTTSPVTGDLFRLRGLQATLTTSAAVANRQVQFILGGANVIRVGAATAVPASQVVNFILAPGIGNYTDAAGNVYIQIPADMILSPVSGDTLRSITGNIQAADQWSAIKYLQEDYVVRE